MCDVYYYEIFKREFFDLYLFIFLWGPLFSRRRRRPVVIRARDLFCRFLRMCDVRPSNLFGSRVECNSWLAPLPKSQTGKWLASACRSIDNIPHPKKVNRITAVPFFPIESRKERTYLMTIWQFTFDWNSILLMMCKFLTKKVMENRWISL
jgi:hypothetical protein